MPAQQSQDGPHAAGPRARKTPKPTLMKSYAAVSDDDLQGIVGKIRSITRSAEARRLSPAVGAREAEAASGPIDQSVDHPVDQSSGQSTNQSTTWPIERSHGRSHDRPDEWSIERPNDTSHGIEAGAAPRNPIVFNLNQAILYHCIYRLEGRTSSLQRISQITGISAFTLKHCLRKLRQEGAIAYHGRQNAGGRIGFGATALPCVMVLRGDEHQLLRRLEEIRFERLPIARAVDPARTAIGDDNGLMNGPITGLLDGPMEAGLCSSSGKKLLLQELVLEDAFRNLNPDSLLPHLEGIGTVAELQDFLDMANACVAAARRTDSPIRNPKGFLIAQLRAGYINPPEDYKSRRIRAQERRNQLLEAELEEIRRLKAKEEELEVELFRARLSPSDRQRLAGEARNRLNPRSPLSETRQIEMAETEILRGWLQAGRSEDDGASTA